jgi:flagellar biogenesis protein FliO
MLSSLALLFLSVASPAAGPVTIEDVNTEMAGDRLIVSVTTSQPVDEQALSAKIAKGRLHLYFQEARVRADRRHFVLPDQTVEVLQRSDYAKVEVPFGEGVSCHGLINVEARAPGARISVGCTGSAAHRAPQISAAEKAQVKAAVALPEEVQAPVAKPAPPKAIAPAAAPIITPVAAPSTVTAGASTSTSTRASSAGGISLTMPMLFLGAIAAVAIYLARRKARKPGMIEILETAHLGPKRSLVIARVAGETMILGTSEAGITLLQGAAPSAEKIENSRMNLVPASFRGAEEPMDEGGMLTRLFRRNQAAVLAERDQSAEGSFDAAEPSEGSEPSGWKDFDDLLSESAEDLELRRKLATGVSMKVS